MSTPPSKTLAGGPPPVVKAATSLIHDALAAYPLAFFTAALVTDIAYASTAVMMWANFSIWLLSGGLLMGALAAMAALWDALARKRRTDARFPWAYALATAIMLIVELINAFVHSRDAWTSVMPTGLALSALGALLAIATTWLRHRLPRQETHR